MSKKEKEAKENKKYKKGNKKEKIVTRELHTL